MATATDNASGTVKEIEKPRKGLPRLGSKPAAELPSQEVELAEAGVSVVLQKIDVGSFVELQERAEGRTEFEKSVALVAAMLTEPTLSEEQLREEVRSLTIPDWVTLQEAATELAGFGEEELRAAQAEFRSAAK